MKLLVSLSNEDTVAKLKGMIGPFLPGIELLTVEVVESGARLSFKIEAGMDFKTMNAVVAKLLRVVPKGTGLGPTRFAGKGEPFVLTLKF